MRFKELKSLQGKQDKGVECSLLERFASLRFVWILMVCCAFMGFWSGCTTVKVMGRKRPLLQYQPIQGSVELSVQSQEDKQKSGQDRRKTTVTVFEEKLNLRTTGDIYHSKLLYFSVGVGVGLTQQEFSSDEGSKKSNGSLQEYDISVGLFPEKPFPIHFYTSKSENLIPRQFQGSVKNETESSGISLSLQSEEYPMRFKYSENETKQDSLSSESSSSDFFQRNEKRFEYSVSHDFSELSQLSFDFDETKVTNKITGSQTNTTTDRYSLVHKLIFGKNEENKLDSFLKYTDQSGQSNSEHVQWGEKLRLRHTGNLSTNYSFRYSDSKQEFSRTTTTHTRVGFRHSLYESLITTGNVFASNTDSGPRGETDRTGGGMSFSYTKENPWGVLLSRYSANLLTIERTGSGGMEQVTNEPHIVPVDTSVLVPLDRAGVDITTIVVKNDGFFDLLLGDDYFVTQSGGRTFLEMRVPPQATVPPNLAVGDTFFVSYKYFSEPQQKEEILRQRFRVRQNFNNGISLYYIFQKQDEDLSSNVTELIPDEFRSDTYGAEYNKGNLELLAEYNKIDSTSLPSTTKLLSGSYSWEITKATTATLKIKNQWQDFGEPDSRDREKFKLGGRISSDLTKRTALDFDFDYIDEDDSKFGPTEGLQLGLDLRYNYRQFSLVTGLEYSLLERESDEDTSALWYIRMRRIF